MIPGGGKAALEQWFAEHRAVYPCPSEAVLLPSIFLLRIIRAHGDLVRLQAGGPGFVALLDHVEEMHDLWRAEWLDANHRQSYAAKLRHDLQY